MRILEIQQGLLVVVLALVSLAVVARGDAFLPASPRVAFARPRMAQDHLRSTASLATYSDGLLLTLRGGATVAINEEEYESDEEEEDEEEDAESDEEEVETEEKSTLDASLAAAALKSTKKTKSKEEASKTATLKKEMSAKLASPKKKKTSLLKMLHVPYVVRAFLNPLTLLSMTKHYWLSLFSLEYPPKDVSQDLRSSLEDKARKGGNSPTQARGKRKMKRGQAKTLSDLPQLST